MRLEGDAATTATRSIGSRVVAKPSSNEAAAEDPIVTSGPRPQTVDRPTSFDQQTTPIEPGASAARKVPTSGSGSGSGSGPSAAVSSLPPRRRQLPSDPRRRPSPRHPILLPVDARNILFSAAVSIWVAGTRLEDSGVSLANPSANLRRRRPPRERRETKDAINLARTSFVFSRTSPRRRFARYRARWRRAHPRRRTIRRTRTSSTRFAPRRRVSPRVHLSRHAAASRERARISNRDARRSDGDAKTRVSSRARVGD